MGGVDGGGFVGADGFDGFDGGIEGFGGGFEGLDGFDGGLVGVAESDGSRAQKEVMNELMGRLTKFVKNELMS